MKNPVAIKAALAALVSQQGLAAVLGALAEAVEDIIEECEPDDEDHPTLDRTCTALADLAKIARANQI